MVSIKENRTLILQKDGSYKEYKKKTGVMHQDCLDDYAKVNELKYSNIKYIINECGCIIFRNLDLAMLLCDMPSDITDEELYQLELFATFNLEDISYMEVKKYKVNDRDEDFILDGNVADKFLKEVIQSYYNKSSSNGKSR